MKVYISVNQEERHHFIDEPNYYYFAEPREIDTELFTEFKIIQEQYENLYEKVAHHWKSLREEKK
jgi:hypothetical protein